MAGVCVSVHESAQRPHSRFVEGCGWFRNDSAVKNLPRGLDDLPVINLEETPHRQLGTNQPDATADGLLLARASASLDREEPRFSAFPPKAFSRWREDR